MIGILTKWPWKNVDGNLRDITRGEESILYNRHIQYSQYTHNFLKSNFFQSFHLVFHHLQTLLEWLVGVGGFKVLGSFFCENVTGLTNRGQLLLPAKKFSSDWQSCKWWGRRERGIWRETNSVDFLAKTLKEFYCNSSWKAFSIPLSCNNNFSSTQIMKIVKIQAISP